MKQNDILFTITLNQLEQMVSFLKKEGLSDDVVFSSETQGNDTTLSVSRYTSDSTEVNCYEVALVSSQRDDSISRLHPATIETRIVNFIN